MVLCLSRNHYSSIERQNVLERCDILPEVLHNASEYAFSTHICCHGIWWNSWGKLLCLLNSLTWKAVCPVSNQAKLMSLPWGRVEGLWDEIWAVGWMMILVSERWVMDFFLKQSRFSRERKSNTKPQQNAAVLHLHLHKPVIPMRSVILGKPCPRRWLYWIVLTF